jgi:hypothetical protein
MTPQKKKIAQQALTAAILVGFPIFLNACNILKGEGIRLWGGDEDKEAATTQRPQKQSDNRPTAPTGAHSHCVPNLSKGTLKPGDEMLEVLAKEVADLEASRSFNGEGIYLKLVDLNLKRHLDLKEPELKGLARNIMARSREQVITPAPSPAPSAAPSPSARPSPVVDAIASADSAVPPIAAQHPLHPSAVAFVAYQNVIAFALDTHGLACESGNEAATVGNSFLNNKGVKEPDTEYVGTFRAYELAKERFASEADPEPARAFVAKVIADKRYDGFKALIAWRNTYEAELPLAVDKGEALEAANKTICYEPGPTHSKRPTAPHRP